MIERETLKDVKVSELIPYPGNPRKTGETVAKVRRSLEKFGYMKTSILVDENMVLIAGHTTLSAIKSMGWETVPEVTRVSGLTDAEKRTYRILDNKLTELSRWDEPLLSVELDNITKAGIDASITGFTKFDIERLIGKLSDESKKIIEQQRYSPGSEYDVKRGDVYKCGKHYVMCGDSSSEEDMKKLFGDRKYCLMVTDPPYNIVDKRGTKSKAKSSSIQPCDKMSKALVEEGWDENFELLPALDVAFRYASDDCTFYVFCSENTIGDAMYWMNSKLNLVYYCVWCKTNPPPSMSKRKWTYATELIAFGAIGKHTFNYTISEHTKNYFEIPATKHEHDHPSEKPYDVIRKLVTVSSKEGDIVYDGFLGSGTTLVVASALGRICYGMELSPKWVGVILKRYATLTGEIPEKISP